MKFIITKKCRDGDVNDIVDVAPGYGSNFLVKKGFAVPLNKSTEHKRKTNLKNEDIAEGERQQAALKAKIAIDSTTLDFELKAKNNVVFGSIGKKQIVSKLKDKGIIIDHFAIKAININSIGKTIVDVKIYKDIIGKLTIRIKEKSG